MKNSKMNYIIEPHFCGTMFNVIETATQQTIKTCPIYKDAKELMRNLNLGSAFDGWTPSFMLKKFTVPQEKSIA